MPLERLVLWIVAAAALLWLAGVIAGAVTAGPAGLLVIVPLVVLGYLLWRVIAERRAKCRG